MKVLICQDIKGKDKIIQDIQDILVKIIHFLIGVFDSKMCIFYYQTKISLHKSSIWNFYNQINK